MGSQLRAHRDLEGASPDASRRARGAAGPTAPLYQLAPLLPAAVAKPHTLRAHRQQKFTSHGLEGRKLGIKVPADSVSSEGSLPGSGMALFLLCSHVAEGTRRYPGSTYQDTNPHHDLITSQRPPVQLSRVSAPRQMLLAVRTTFTRSSNSLGLDHRPHKGLHPSLTVQDGCSSPSLDVCLPCAGEKTLSL